MSELEDKLDFDLWATSGIRFAQSKRYRYYQQSLFLTLLVISFYLSASSLIFPIYFSEDQEVLNIYIGVSSFLITILGLVLKNADYSDRSRKLHNCGREIRCLITDLKVASNEKELIAISNQYNKILDNYENHHDIDRYYFWLQNYNKVVEDKKQGSPNWFSRYLIAPLVYYIIPFGLPLLSAIAPFCILSVLVKCT